jgi:hypothetical protein
MTHCLVEMYVPRGADRQVRDSEARATAAAAVGAAAERADLGRVRIVEARVPR